MRKNIASLFLIFLGSAVLSCSSKSGNENIDHIILAINDLEAGVAQFRDLTGVEPVFGGIHPNSFTQNAIVSLGNDSYIEILAPRTDLDSIPDWIMQYKKLTPIGWAVGTRNPEATRNTLSKFDVSVSDPEPGSRQTSSGEVLSWVTFGLPGDESFTFPFFICWDQKSVHPSASAPGGCQLAVLKLTSHNRSLKNVVESLDLDIVVLSASEDRIEVEIESPKGSVRF